MVAMLRKSEITMDLIRNNIYAVSKTYIPYSGKLLRCPYTTHGIVGAAEDKELHFVFLYLVIKIIEIDQIFSVLINKPALDKPAIIIFDNTEERIKYRRLDKDTVAGLGQCADSHCQSKNHSRSCDQPIFLREPVETV